MSLPNSYATETTINANLDLITARKSSVKQIHPQLSPSLEVPLPTSEALSQLSSDSEIESEAEGQVETTTVLPNPQNLGNRCASTQQRPLISVPNECDPATTDRPSHVSLLAGKYLLFANNDGSSKDFQKCINVETREQFMCKVVPRNASGLGLLAAYHRLEEFSDCIGSIHEIVLAPKSLYMIFPLNYGSVHSYILARKRVSEAEAALLFKQIVSAVHYCHGKGIVLRDLKMGKFVFADKERTIVKLESLEDAVILSDFSDDGLSDKHGCPNYVSPEKADILRSNSKYPGKATDVWGLGVILYTMLVGRYPFNDADHTKLFVKIRKGHFTLPDSLSSSVKCLIRCLLRKDPSGRLNCQQILKHPWIVNKGSPVSRSSEQRVHSSISRALRHIRGPTIPTLRSSPSHAVIHTNANGDYLPDTDDQVVPEMCMTK